MVWAITFTIFTATVVAVLLLFVVFSKREQIKEALREQRIETRTPVRVGLSLHDLNEPFNHEMVLSENVSRHGARVVTRRPWQMNDRLLVGLPRDVSSPAQVAYCHPLPGDLFAIGLRFSSEVDMEDYRPPFHPGRKYG